MAVKLWRTMLIVTLICLLSLTGFFGYFIYTVLSMEELPPLDNALTTRFYYANGDLLASRSVENRIEIPQSEMPLYAQQAVIAVEDERFYSHPGIDVMGLARAVYVNLQERRIAQGGSTITQQLARNLFLTHDRTFNRKFQEAALTLHLERKYSKDEILEKYLNTIYFGRGSYGIEAASLTYFGKNARDLSLAEATFLVGMPQRPAMSVDAALRRQRIILTKMLELDYVHESEYKAALEEDLEFYQRGERLNSLTQYFVDEVIYKELSALRSQHEEADLIYQGGLKIYTTLDPSMQQAAENAFNNHMPLVQRTSDKGVEQPQGALVAMDPETGHVKALIGGRNFQQTQFNRAIDARRSAGSAFKPLVYAAAMERAGFTAATTQECKPISINIPGVAKPYEPRDYGGTFHHRPLTIREALLTSCNISAVKANMAVGPAEVVKFAERMGIKSDVLDPVVSLPLSSEVTALEMTVALTPFANRGIKTEPVFVTRVEDPRGNVLLDKNRPEQEVVLDEGIAFIISDMLRDVLGPEGTADHLARYIDRPTAAKTGTAENEKSVYMVGYTRDLVVSVYVGDDNQNYALKPGSTGGNVAGPIWASFMQEAHMGMAPRDFEQPQNVIQAALCPETGLLASPDCSLEAQREYFIIGTQPQEECGPDNCSGHQQQWWWPWRPKFWRDNNAS